MTPRLRAKDHNRRVGAPPDGVTERYTRPFDLARPSSSTKLPDEFNYLAERRSTEGLSLGQEAATGIHRKRAPHLGYPRLQESARLTFGAESQFFVANQLARAIGVLEFHDVSVPRPDACLFEGRSCRQLGRRGKVVVD